MAYNFGENAEHLQYQGNMYGFRAAWAFLRRRAKCIEEYVKNVFCIALSISFGIVSVAGESHATVRLKNVGSEPVHVMEITYNVLTQRWYRDGWYTIRAGRYREFDEGCCNGNPWNPWRRSHEIYIAIMDDDYNLLKYKWAHGVAERKVCLKTRKSYDEEISLFKEVGLFGNKQWPSEFMTCKKGEKPTTLYHIPDYANILKTITIRGK